MDIATHTIRVTKPKSGTVLQLQQADFGALLEDVRDMLQSTHDERAAAAKVAAKAAADKKASAKQAAKEPREQEEKERRAAFEPKLALLLEKLHKHAAQTGVPLQGSLTASNLLCL